MRYIPRGSSRVQGWGVRRASRRVRRSTNGALQGYILTRTSPQNPNEVDWHVPTGWQRDICPRTESDQLGAVIYETPTLTEMKKDFEELLFIVVSFRDAMKRRWGHFKRAVINPVRDKGAGKLYFPTSQDPDVPKSAVQYLQQEHPKLYWAFKAFVELDKEADRAIDTVHAGLSMIDRAATPTVDIERNWQKVNGWLEEWRAKVPPEQREELGLSDLGNPFPLVALIWAAALVASVIGASYVWRGPLQNAIAGVTGLRTTVELIEIMEAQKRMMLDLKAAGIAFDADAMIKQLQEMLKEQMKPRAFIGAVAGWATAGVVALVLGFAWLNRKRK